MFENRILPVLILIVALVVPTALSGQVRVDVSNEKIVSGGRTYYLHHVLKDQTLYSISKAYKVSIEAITRENVIPPNGIQTDQVLKIPESAAMAQERARAVPPAQVREQQEAPPPEQPKAQAAAQKTKPAEPAPRAEAKEFRMHKVKKGETLYSISRDYNVTVAAIIRENDVPRNEIQAGQMLKIPPSDFETFVQEEPEQEAKPDALPNAEVKKEPEAVPANLPHAEVKQEPAEKPKDVTETKPQPQSQNQAAAPAPEKKPAKPEPKKYHKVQKGESLSDIAKKYNVSVREIKEANDGLLFPMPGMKLVIPAGTGEAADTTVKN
jgi:LysM repeat protein